MGAVIVCSWRQNINATQPISKAKVKCTRTSTPYMRQIFIVHFIRSILQFREKCFNVIRLKACDRGHRAFDLLIVCVEDYRVLIQGTRDTQKYNKKPDIFVNILSIFC